MLDINSIVIKRNYSLKVIINVVNIIASRTLVRASGNTGKLKLLVES